MFNIVEITASGPVVVLDDEGKPLEYYSGAAAAEICSTLKRDKGGTYRPRVVTDDSWKERELARFNSGEYQYLPWAGLPWFENNVLTKDHFAHVSVENGAMVAYTESADKGVADRQTRVKAGRYLTQFFSHALTPEAIARLATDFVKQYEAYDLQFAVTADEIEHVYANGPHSCMAHDADYFSSPVHPVRVYAAGDLQVAYLERDGDITARALVWPERKIHSRIYGDESRLETLLASAGYKPGNLRGARLTRIPCHDAFVVPYLDCTISVRDARDYLVIDPRGEIDARETNGLSTPLFRCEECDRGICEGEIFSTYDGCYCESCYGELFVFCERTDSDVRADQACSVLVRDDDGNIITQTWGRFAARRWAVMCDKTDQYCERSLAVEMDGSAAGETWSVEALVDYGFTCEGNGLHYPIGDLIVLNDHTKWSEEHFAEYGIEVDGGFYRKSDAPLDALNYIEKSADQMALEIA